MKYNNLFLTLDVDKLDVQVDNTVPEKPVLIIRSIEDDQEIYIKLYAKKIFTS